MDSMQELIPFAKEMLRQKPGRGLLKIYLLGSVLAVLGTHLGDSLLLQRSSHCLESCIHLASKKKLYKLKKSKLMLHISSILLRLQDLPSQTCENH
uniref:Uncharacterized protein n=1 Tax=Oryzias latipes TaxID=8090 RepID=A0A3B3H4E0_ORYLA